MVGAGIVVAPATTGVLLVAIAAGIGLGVVSGLTPGVHANNFALVLASVAPAVPGPPTAVAAAILAAGVTHTFLDVVPALALGVPDAAMAATALPGHRLVLAGRGREALRLSAIGSGTAVLLAAPLAIPVTEAMRVGYPVLQEHLRIALAAVTILLVASEPTWRRRSGAVGAAVLSGALGWATLDLTPSAPLDAGGILAPLFAGLFGAPILLAAMDGEGPPPQADPAITIPSRQVATTAAVGSGAGSIVAYVPGVSSAIAAVAALLAVPDSSGDRGFLIASSGVNTSNTVFALFALVTFGVPRTGVMVALDAADLPLALPVLVLAVAIAAAVGAVLVIVAGERYLRLAGRIDQRHLSLGVMSVLVTVSWLFAGWFGVAVFAVAALVGRVPPAVGARRVHLMNVLLVPIALGV